MDSKINIKFDEIKTVIKEVYGKEVDRLEFNDGSIVAYCGDSGFLVPSIAIDSAKESTKEEKQYKYEKVTESKLSALVASYENGEEFYFDNKEPMSVYAAISCYRHGDPIYRRIELSPEEAREQEIEELAREYREMLNDGCDSNDLARFTIEKLKG